MVPRSTERRASLRELFSVDLRSLAALRIALALLLLGDLATRAPYLGLHHSEHSLFPAALVNAPWHFSIYTLGATGTAAVLYALAALGALMLLVGWRSRLASVASWLLVTSLQVRNPFLTNNGDILLRMLLLWGMFLPLGARWSLDARRRGPAPATSVVSAGTVAVLLQLVFVYLAAGIVKSTQPWRDGSAVQLFLGNATLGRPLGTALREHPGWTELITYTTPPFEILGVLLLFLPWRTASVRLFLLPCFWLFQLGLGTCLQLQLFPWSSTAATLPFLPARFWELLGRLRGRRAAVPRAEPPPAAARAARSPAARVAQVVVAALLSYTALLNAPTLFLKPEWEKLETMAPARFLGIVQSWRLYSVVPRKDTSLEILGLRVDGRPVNVLGPGDDEVRPWLRRVHGEYRMKHQLLLLARRFEEYHPLLRRHLDWVCREWNATRQGSGALSRLQCVRLERFIRLDGLDPPERTVVAEHECETPAR